MYTVHMKRVTATEARRRLFQLLDAVENGEDIVLERSGVRFRLTLDKARERAEDPGSPLIVDDPALLEGDWTWQTDEDGQLVFQSRRDSPS